MNIGWKVLPFERLSVHELYAALQLRNEVFSIEQHCVYQDMDDADPQALHLMGWQGEALQAYARLFPAGIKFNEASIGRVIIRRSARGQGLGHVLIDEAVAALHKAWGVQAIRIGAQSRLARYYSSHGFVDVSVPFMEDGIPHIEMLHFGTPLSAR